MSDGACEHILHEFERYGGEILPRIKQFSFFTNRQKQTVRQWEIAEWLLSNGDRVRNWVALDDDMSISEDPRYLELCAGHVVQTTPTKGLTEEDADIAIRILKRSSAS